MKVSYQFDQDPRYGWADIDLEGLSTAMIVIHTQRGSFGFNFVERDASIRPTCICSAWSAAECSCPHLGPDFWGESRD